MTLISGVPSWIC